MFTDIEDLRQCIITNTPQLSETLVRVIFARLTEGFPDEKIAEVFKIVLAQEEGAKILYKNIKKADFVGGEGANFIDGDKVVKVLLNDKKTKIGQGDSVKTICSFINAALNNILIKAILKRAFETGKTKEDLSRYFVEIETIKMAKYENEEILFSDELDDFYQEEIFQIQLTTKYFPTEWSKESRGKKKKVACKIYSILYQLEKLATQHGVTICHGDLKYGNILLDGNGEVKIIDFGWTSVKIHFTCTPAYILTYGNNWTGDVVHNYRYVDLLFFSFNAHWYLNTRYVDEVDFTKFEEIYADLFDEETNEAYSDFLERNDIEANDIQYDTMYTFILKYLNKNQGIDYREMAKTLMKRI